MGDIGENQREYEFEPLETPSIPVPEQTPETAPAPAEPEKVPANV